jgi:hypothetical protein
VSPTTGQAGRPVINTGASWRGYLESYRIMQISDLPSSSSDHYCHCWVFCVEERGREREREEKEDARRHRGTLVIEMVRRARRAQPNGTAASIYLRERKRGRKKKMPDTYRTDACSSAILSRVAPGRLLSWAWL